MSERTGPLTDDAIAQFLRARSGDAEVGLLDDIVRAVGATTQDRPPLGLRPILLSRRTLLIVASALLLAAMGAMAIGSGLLVEPSPTEDPSVDLGIFEPVAGRIVYYTDSSLWAVDPAAPADPPTTVQLTSEAGIPLGWSSDGTRLLIMREIRDEPASSIAAWHLFVLHADGSETQVTEGPMEIQGATISPDGSRVVFVGGTEDPEGGCCIGTALYAVDAEGGPAEMLREARNGIVEEPTFSPDGTRIAFVDGAGDSNHHVWVMNADGSDAHEIVSEDCACHVYGLAWSPAGDRIALGLEGTTYTFATDGSAFTPVITRGDRPYWSPDGSQFAYTISCVADPNGCGLAIADADGSNVLTFGSGASGPWHPGTLDLRPQGRP